MDKHNKRGSLWTSIVAVLAVSGAAAGLYLPLMLK